jgi:hypothetical protein
MPAHDDEQRLYRIGNQGERPSRSAVLQLCCQMGKNGRDHIDGFGSRRRCDDKFWPDVVSSGV